LRCGPARIVNLGAERGRPQPAEDYRHFGNEVGKRRIADGPLYFMMSPAPPPVKLHRIENHQLYHHYLGDPIEVLMLPDDGTHTFAVVGSDAYRSRRVMVKEAATSTSSAMACHSSSVTAPP